MGTVLKDDVVKEMKNLSFLPKIYYYWNVTFRFCEILLENPNIMEFVNSNEKYDLFIGSPFYFLECSIAVAHHLKLPILNIFSNRIPNHFSHQMGHIYPYSYVVDYLLPFSNNMNFWQRLANSVFGLGYSLGLSMYYIPKMNRIVHKHFPELPPVQEMMGHVPVTLLNTNLAVHPSQPLPPGVIPVGGMTIPQKADLPQDLQTWMDSANEGVILFSLGTAIRTKAMDPNVLYVLMSVFSKLPQRVLMKWESQHLDGKPSNVRLAKWIPQAAVLAHPHCQLFITHGGLHSWMEAVHYAVPLLGIYPSFLDQPHNLAEMQERGHGLYFSGPWTEESLLAALKEVLHNPKYKESIQKASKVFWDQPMNPLQTAVYWTEYVIRHKGAHHLQSATSTMRWYQIVLLDVLGALLLSVLVPLVAIRTILRWIKRAVVDYEYIVFNRMLRVFNKLKLN